MCGAEDSMVPSSDSAAAGEDGLTWTIKLNPNAAFSSGKALTAMGLPVRLSGDYDSAVFELTAK